ncbi:Uncharacterized protein Fot_06926 [Forsythia ovata]|uniref:Uncharacterized protein n=1 Tax=Forsythia ovata TaxID=205694 RepID=A0ABD1WUP4_9LAMI
MHSYLFNTNAALTEEGAFGTGEMIRDHLGVVVEAKSRQSLGCLSVENAEANVDFGPCRCILRVENRVVPKLTSYATLDRNIFLQYNVLFLRPTLISHQYIEGIGNALMTTPFTVESLVKDLRGSP